MLNNEIEELYQSLSLILKQHTVAKEPLTPSLINLMKSIVDDFYSTIIKLDEEYEKYKTINKEKAKEYQKKYLDKIKLLTNNKNKNIEINIEDVRKKISAIGNENTELKKNNENKNKEYLMEIDWFKISNEQSLISIEKDMNNSLSRLLYQLQTAKNSYREYIEEHNNDYNEKKEIEAKKYESEINQYTEESSNLISIIDKKINIVSNSLQNETNIYEGIKKQQNEVRRNNTVEINSAVRKLVNEKNQYILGERFGYTKYQSINRVELEFKRKELQGNNQKNSKDYMRKISKLEIENAKIRNEYQEKRDIIEREFQYFMIVNHKSEEKELKNFIASSSDTISLSKISKTYSIKYKQEKKKRDKALRDIEKKYKSKLITNDYIRQKLDINRDYDIRINNEMESKENKYFQELNNIDENDFKYKSKYYTIDYANKTNKIKSDNNLQMLKIESKYDKINSQHQIEIEKLTNELKKLNIEHESLKKIETKILDIEKRRHEKNMQYIAIINMLEIEKAKVLNEYNKSNYDLNIMDINYSLEFSKNSIKLQDERKEKENHILIDIENKEYEKKVNENNNKIAWLNTDLDFTLKRIDQVYNYDIEKLLNTLFYKKFLLESKTINQIITTVALIFKKALNSSRDLINSIFNSVIIRPEHIYTLREILSRLYLPIDLFFNKVISNIRNEVNIIVDERNELALEFKFKSNYNQIQSDYDEAYNQLNNELTKINESINNININLERSNQARFSISNHINKMKTTKKNKEHRDALLTSLYKYDADITTLNNKLVEKERQKTELDRKIELIKSEKEKTELEVLNLKNESIIVYTDLLKSLDLMLQNQQKLKPNILNDGTEITFDNYDEFINDKCEDINSYIDLVITNFYDLYKNFVENSTITNNKNTNSTESFNERSTNKLNKEYNNAKQDMFEKNNSERHKFNFELNSLKNKHNAILKENDEKVKILNKKRNEKYKEQYRIKDNIDTKFHNDFYALQANENDIISDYNNTLISLNSESMEYKKEIITNKDLQYKTIDTNYSRYSSDKNEFIKSLPKNLKNDEREIIKENTELRIHNEKQKVLDRNKYFKNRTDYFKNIFLLNTSYSYKIKDLNKQRRMDIKREKHRLALKLKKA